MAAKLKVGDIVELVDDQPAPADMLVLSTSSPAGDGVAYVETAQLDGETNLKRRVALECTAELAATRHGASHMRGRVMCEPPHHGLSTYKARVELTESKAIEGGKTSDEGEIVAASAGREQLMVRGEVLRNTPWVRCLVVYW